MSKTVRFEKTKCPTFYLAHLPDGKVLGVIKLTGWVGHTGARRKHTFYSAFEQVQGVPEVAEAPTLAALKKKLEKLWRVLVEVA